MGGKVGENPAALRAAVFSLSSKNLGGSVQTPPPPSRARVKVLTYLCVFSHKIVPLADWQMFATFRPQSPVMTAPQWSYLPNFLTDKKLFASHDGEMMSIKVCQVSCRYRRRFKSYCGEMKWNRGKRLPDRGRLETTLYYLYLSWAFNPRPVRGVDATPPPPHEFFWAGRHTVWKIVLKFSIAYGASFAKLLVKKIWSGQVRSRSYDVIRGTTFGRFQRNRE